MGKRRSPRRLSQSEAASAADGAIVANDNASGVSAFAFGDPEPVLDRRELMGYVETWNNGRWYEPPISFAGLVRAFGMSAHHSSAILVKRNLLIKTFRPSRWLTRAEFGKLVKDYLVLGNGYLQRQDNLAGRPLQLVHSPALYTRRGVEEGRFWWVPGFKGETEFLPGTVWQLTEQDLRQEIYGLPEYLSALQSGLLNEAATLFRRRYYLNGSHAGFIFYLTDPNVSNKDVDSIRQALKDSKGPGNFRNLFLHSPRTVGAGAAAGGEGLKLIPVAEVAAKDIFADIKNTTRDDVLAAHRVPPQLLGVVPVNAGGFGDVSTSSLVFFRNEIEPLQMRFLELNDWLGLEAIAFDPYDLAVAPAA